MKNIIFSSWSGAFFNPGGGEVQLLNTKKALEKKAYNIQLFNQWDPQKNADIVHHFSLELGSSHVVNLYKELNKKIAIAPIIYAEPPKGEFAYNHHKNLMMTADILFTNSHKESELLSKHFEIPLEKFHKTRNAISEEYYTLGNPDLFLKKYNIKEDFILSVANIDRRKNTEQLAKACEELKIPLYCIGHIRDIPYYDSFKNNYKYLNYLGPTSDFEMIKSAMCAAKLFALPSLCETPGIAALEAAAQGCQIVITDNGPTEEYFGVENITLVNPFDYQSIVKGIGREWHSQRGDNLRKKVITDYTWDLTADDIIEGYRKLKF